MVMMEQETLLHTESGTPQTLFAAAEVVGDQRYSLCRSVSLFEQQQEKVQTLLLGDVEDISTLRMRNWRQIDQAFALRMFPQFQPEFEIANLNCFQALLEKTMHLRPVSPILLYLLSSWLNVFVFSLNGLPYCSSIAD